VSRPCMGVCEIPSARIEMGDWLLSPRKVPVPHFHFYHHDRCSRAMMLAPRLMRSGNPAFEQAWMDENSEACDFRAASECLQPSDIPKPTYNQRSVEGLSAPPFLCRHPEFLFEVVPLRDLAVQPPPQAPCPGEARPENPVPMSFLRKQESRPQRPSPVPSHCEACIKMAIPVPVIARHSSGGTTRSNPDGSAGRKIQSAASAQPPRSDLHGTLEAPHG